MVRLPTASEPDTSWYWGAVVSYPESGLHDNVTYFDLWSLYPNTIRTLNASLETIVGTQAELDESPYDESECVWGYYDPRGVKRVPADEDWGQYVGDGYKCIRQHSDDGLKKRWTADEIQFERFYFVKRSVATGRLTQVVDDFMELKAEHKGDPRYAAVKACVNSLYGFVGDPTSRLYNNRMAEAVTLASRRIIRFTVDRLLHHLGDIVPSDTYVTHIDTDGVGIAQPDVDTHKQCLDNAHQAMERVNDEYGSFLGDEFGSDAWWMEVETDWFSPRLFLPGPKKRYAVHRTVDDGESVDEVKVTGMDCVRSDVADVTAEEQREVLERLVTQPLDDALTSISERLRDVCEEIESGDYPLQQLGKRSGFSKPPTEYGTTNRTPMPIRRGAKFSNKHLGENIGEGSKPMKFPVDRILDDDLPERYSANTAEDGDEVDYVTVTDITVLDGRITIDRDEIIEKYVRDPIEPILEAVGHSWDEAISGQTQLTIGEAF